MMTYFSRLSTDSVTDSNTTLNRSKETYLSVNLDSYNSLPLQRYIKPTESQNPSPKVGVDNLHLFDTSLLIYKDTN